MATDQQFCLRWNNHQSTLISVFDSLLENGTLVDCTLAAEGQYLKAHKVVLSACSPYLETLLSQHYEKHPIVILKDVKFTELKSMMDYMYRGEVNISQDQLGTFLKAAESLQIKGLSDNGDDARDVGSTVTKRQDAPSRPSVTQVRTPVESKRPAPSGDISDASRDGSISPSSLRKRRRTRRSSQGDDLDLDATNSCDLPSQAQSNPLPVPSSTVVPTPVQNLPKQIVKQEPSISRLDNSPIAPESGLLKEKIEPPSEPLLEPKTEYLDYMNNENSIEVEDLTLDDDEEDLNSSMDSSRPGPSHGDMSNQGYPPWPMTGDQSGTDEIFMAAQQAVGAATGQQRDSQDDDIILGDRFDPIFVSATCLEQSSDIFFPELNNSMAINQGNLETGLFYFGSETDQFKRDKFFPSEDHNYYAYNKHLVTMTKTDSYESVTQQCANRFGLKQGVKRQEIGNKHCSQSNLFRSAGDKYFSLRGRKRKLRMWSGDSFNIHEINAKDCETTVSEKEPHKILKNCPPNFLFSNKNKGSEQKQKKHKILYYPPSNVTLSKEERNKPINYHTNKQGRAVKRWDFIHRPGGFECCKCGLQYKYLRGLRTHQKLSCDMEPLFPCTFCSLKCHTNQTLIKHIKRRHSDGF